MSKNLKTCNNCGKTKLNSKFYKDKYSKDGLTHICKECSKEKSREYYRKNKDKSRKSTKKWIKNNKKKWKEYKKRYRKENKEKIKEYKKKHIRKNKDRYRELWRKNKRKRRKEDKKFKLNSNIGRSIWNCLKRDKNGRHWEDLVGYTVEELKEHLEEQFEDWMSWDNWGRVDEDYRTWNIDHIKPKSSFDFDSPEDKEFKECWALKNLQPLESRKNIKKSNNLKDNNYVT